MHQHQVRVLPLAPKPLCSPHPYDPAYRGKPYMSGIHSPPCRSAVLHVGCVSSELHYPLLNLSSRGTKLLGKVLGH